MALTYTPQTTETSHSTTAAATDDDDALKKRLLSRIAVAGVVIVGLLGGLAVYDSLNKPQAPAMPKMAAAPAPPPIPINPGDVVQPAAPAATEKPAEAPEQAAAKPAADEKLAETAPAAIPERTDTPRSLGPAEQPLKAAKPVTPPATARSAAIKPSPPAAALQKPDAQREIARVMPERDAPGSAKAAAPPARPLAQAGEAARRFLVQVGVFSNHANAEELLARLHQAGIPAQIESRVQVGPFATRAEADAARAKLKSLGLDEGMLVRR